MVVFLKSDSRGRSINNQEIKDEKRELNGGEKSSMQVAESGWEEDH
jgi:hypothetical protein